MLLCGLHKLKKNRNSMNTVASSTNATTKCHYTFEFEEKNVNIIIRAKCLSSVLDVQLELVANGYLYVQIYIIL